MRWFFFNIIIIALSLLPMKAQAQGLQQPQYSLSRTKCRTRPSDPNGNSYSYGASLHWNTRTIDMVIYEPPEVHKKITQEQFTAIENSMRAWEHPDISDIQFRIVGVTDDNEVGRGDGAASGCFWNTIIFRTDYWEGAYEQVALTITQYDPETGVIYDADLLLNAVNFNFGTSESYPLKGTADYSSQCDKQLFGKLGTYDLQNTVTHELGHVIGFDHSGDLDLSGDPSKALNATMYFSAQPCETNKRVLTFHDLSGLHKVYPKDQPTYFDDIESGDSRGVRCFFGSALSEYGLTPSQFDNTAFQKQSLLISYGIYDPIAACSKTDNTNHIDTDNTPSDGCLCQEQKRLSLFHSLWFIMFLFAIFKLRAYYHRNF